MRCQPPFDRVSAHVTFLICAIGALLAHQGVLAQGLTGTIIGSVRDQQGNALAGALVRISSPELIGGPATARTDERGKLRFPALPPGTYALDVELAGFKGFRDPDLRVGPGLTLERSVILMVGLAESLVVEGPGSQLDARDPGFSTRFGPDAVRSLPIRRASMFDFIRAAPGVTATSPSSGTATTISAFGSGTNENQFLIDGTNTTCPCNGAARSEPGVDFIQEVQIQSVGASAEFGNLQGAVVNVITRQGGERLSLESSFYAQPSALTSQPVRLPYRGSSESSGYGRALHRDVTVGAGGPVVRERLWFYAGYQHLRDHDSQPGTDPAQPRTYEMEKVFAKLTWRLAPGLQLNQSFHDEIGINPDRPTIVTPWEATTRPRISVPAVTLGHLTHTVSGSTVWDVRVGRFVHTRDEAPSTGSLLIPSRFDLATGVTSGAPPRVGSVTISRTTAKATVTHYRASLLGADHQWKAGGQIERGEHHAITIIPTGTRYEDRLGVPQRSISADPSNIGAVAISASLFATDAMTIGDRLTIQAGVRFDRSRAVSQDLAALDDDGHETSRIVPGRGTLWTWNQWSPRLGVTGRLTRDGRTLLRASYGRFYQGVLTGELESFHPGATAVETVEYESSTGGYTGARRLVDPAVNLLLDPETHAPRTDEYSAGIDRAIGRGVSVAAAYVHKQGRDYIGWTENAGQYAEGSALLADNSQITVHRLTTAPRDRRYLLTNPHDYSLTYHGLVIAAEKRRSDRWRLFGSYTLSRATGLLPSSGASGAGPQASTVSPPQPLLFGRDPNDLTNASGRLPNDRRHMFRGGGTVEEPRTRMRIAGSFQHVTGKPWTPFAQVTLPQGEQRIMLEPRGSRRLSSQTLLDVRVSRPWRMGSIGEAELMLEILNLLNDTAEESLATETKLTATTVIPAFGRPASFVDPRRGVLSMHVRLGR